MILNDSEWMEFSKSFNSSNSPHSLNSFISLKMIKYLEKCSKKKWTESNHIFDSELCGGSMNHNKKIIPGFFEAQDMNIFRNVPQCGSRLWHCAAETSCFDIFCSVKVPFVLWIYEAFGIKISLRIRIFIQKLELGMIFYPTMESVHRAPSDPVSIR